MMRTPEFHALADRASELLFGADGRARGRGVIAQRRVPGWLAGRHRRRRPLVGLVALSPLAFQPPTGTTFTPVPSPFAVLGRIVDDGLSAYWASFKVTITEAACGFVYGNVLALAPRLDRAARPAARAGRHAGRRGDLLPAARRGRRHLDRRARRRRSAGRPVGHGDLPGGVRGVLHHPGRGAARLQVRRQGQPRCRGSSAAAASPSSGRCAWSAALPSILNALQIAVPTAFLGAVLGEYMGATDRSVGIMLIRLQGNLDSVRVWAVFLLCALVALVGYGGARARLPAAHALDVGQQRPSLTRPASRSGDGAASGTHRRSAIGRSVASSWGAWQAVVSFSGISHLRRQGSRRRLAFPVRHRGGRTQHRRGEPASCSSAWERLRDAAMGFAVGITDRGRAGDGVHARKTVESGVMPLALLLRSVPLVAIAPVIILITGRGTTTSVAVIGTLVVLFPALASVMFGLSRANRQSLDLVHVYGGSDLDALRKVAIPGALPVVLRRRPGLGARRGHGCAVGGVALDRQGDRREHPEVQRRRPVRQAVGVGRDHHPGDAPAVQPRAAAETFVLSRMGMSQRQP